jgi:transcriptional regulator NrdR family protein
MGQSTLAKNDHNHVVKRKGHTEQYDERKLYASIYAACLAVRETHETSEMIAERVTKEINEWLMKKHEITSHDIRVHAAHHLTAYQPDAGWLYLHQRNLS